MKKSIIVFLLTALIALSSLTGCTASTTEPTSNNSTTTNQQNASAPTPSAVSTANSSTQTTSANPAGSYSSEDSDSFWDASKATSITLNQSSIEVDGAGASVNGSIVTITNAGTYVLSGTLEDGQVIVDADKNDLVRLVLNGVTLSCSTNAPIYSKQADKTILILADGSQNTVQDATQYVYATGEDEPDAAIFSKDSLSINGSGSLTVTGNFNNGIGSKDDLVITSGNFVVSAPNDALRGRDSISISGGNFQLDAQGDGIKSNNDTDTQKGWICLDGGTFQITSGNDAVQAETSLKITGGDYTITTAGGSANAAAHVSNDRFGFGRQQNQTTTTETTTSVDETVSDSYKALKASTTLEISGGTFQIDAEDDAIHSNGDVTIQGGNFNIATGDDGIHADSALVINDGTIFISTSYEGLEGATVDINGGDVRLTASDDGINSAGGSDSDTLEAMGNMQPPQDGTQPPENSSAQALPEFTPPAQDGNTPPADDRTTPPTPPEGFTVGDSGSANMGNPNKMMGRPNQDSFAAKGDYYIRITGGFVWVDAAGDGLDSNNALYIDGGTVIVNGPTNSGNGALDYDGSCVVSGGTLIASGSSGMAQAPGSSSTQNILMVYYDSTQAAETLVNLSDANGNSILTYAPNKDYQCIVISTPDLKQGETYTLSSGGTASSESNGGLYDGGYSSGTKLTDVTLSNVLTQISQNGSEVTGGMGMGGGRGGIGGGMGKGNRENRQAPQSAETTSTPPSENQTAQ